MNCPDGVETVEFMKESGWMDLADENMFCLFVLEPGENGWGTPEEELEFFRTAYHCERTNIFSGAVPEANQLMTAPCLYVVGYGEVGTAMQEMVMESRLAVAAAAFVDASEVPDDFLASFNGKSFNTDTQTYDVDYNDCPVPVLIAGEETEQSAKMIDYWKTSNRSGDEGSEEAWGTSYKQTEDTMYTPCGNVLETAVTTETLDPSDPAATKNIFDFLYRFYRYGMSVPAATC